MVGETNTTVIVGQDEMAATPTCFSSANLLDQALNKTAIEVYIYSDTYKDLLLKDYRNLPINDPAAADKLFSRCGFSGRLAYSPTAQIEAWEYILDLMAKDDADRYEKLHKGTPFYFIGMASYYSRDFEKALFYMDAALEEDLALHKEKWPDNPAGKFVLLQEDSPDQAAKPLVKRTREAFESLMKAVTDLGGIGLSVEDFRNKLVRPAMTVGSGKRSAVTALFSFLLEFSSREKELSLAGRSTSTGEPFFIHLLKGAVLFETLLKTSPVGSAIQSGNPKATINDLLKSTTIYPAFGFATVPQGFGVHTFDEVLDAIRDDKTGDFSQRAVRATWGIRNTTGHSMGWPYRPDPDEYKNVYHLIAGALSATLSKLHP